MAKTGRKPRNLRHLLLQDGVLASLTNDQICPLHNNNTDKEGGVAGVLKNFSLTVGLQGIKQHRLLHCLTKLSQLLSGVPDFIS